MASTSRRPATMFQATAVVCLALAGAAYFYDAGTEAQRETSSDRMSHQGARAARLMARPQAQQPASGRITAFGQEDYALVASFDADKNGRLNAAERQAARVFAEANGYTRGWNRRFGFEYQPEPGPAMSPDDVRPYPTTPFFDQDTLRTLFLTFENDDWERELMAFKSTDVDVPAKLVVDGRTYEDVGIQFHGNSSFNGVPMGFKHSMRLALDFANENQNLAGNRSLLLLNAHEDPTYLRTMLAMTIARAYYPAPRVNLVRVVINGENWGIYVNQQHFNRDMTADLFKATGGSRWRVHGTRGDIGGGLVYMGETDAPYRRAYEIRTADRPQAWDALKRLTRVLNETVPERLESALAPLLDVDGTLRFLAVENAIVNTDGYWTKASDYNLYMDPSGQFHLLPYDVNGTFATGMGPAGSRTGSVWLDPLDAVQDPSKPLLMKLLAAPALRDRYLGYVRDVAETWLDWNHLGPLVAKYQTLISRDVQAETRKLVSTAAFLASATELRTFAEQRRAVLLKAMADGDSKR